MVFLLLGALFLILEAMPGALFLILRALLLMLVALFLVLQAYTIFSTTNGQPMLVKYSF